MTGDPVRLVLTAAGDDCRAAAAALFPGVPVEALGREQLRPRAPFAGPLFTALGERPRGEIVGLVAPGLRAADAAGPPARDAAAGPAGDAPAGPPAGAVPDPAPGATDGPPVAFAPGDLVPVADHVGLEARGPLTDRWPAGVPRDFPSMTGIYQPAYVRPRPGARVYSSGVVAAGVAGIRRLTRFEARAVREGGWPIVTDSLVPVAVVAAYYGVRLAACVLVQAPRPDRE